MKVRATKDGGYYNLKRRKEGDVFEMKDEHYKWTDKEKVQRTCTWAEPASNKPKAKEKPGAKPEDNEEVI